jgi:hypothetical protein
MPGLSLNDFAKQELGYAPGTKLNADEADTIRRAHRQYMDKIAGAAADRASGGKPEVAPEIRDVPNPDGRGATRMAKLSNGSWQILPEYKAPEMRMTQAEDGTIILVDPVTGANFPSYNKDTGAGVKGAKKLDPFAFLGNEPQQQSRPSAQSGSATLEPPPMAPSAMAPTPAATPAQANAPTIYSISGEADYAKVPAGATVSWNGQTFTKR